MRRSERDERLMALGAMAFMALCNGEPVRTTLTDDEMAQAYELLEGADTDILEALDEELADEESAS